MKCEKCTKELHDEANELFEVDLHFKNKDGEVIKTITKNVCFQCLFKITEHAKEVKVEFEDKKIKE